MNTEFKQVVLPGDRDKVIYNCYDQQVMTFAYYYAKEYWKLFLNTKMEFEDKDSAYLEDIITTNTYINEAALKYYGLKGIEVPDESELTFDQDELYLISMNVKDYPFSREIEEEGEHCFIIYGKNSEGYLVNDNYYHVTDFVLDEESYKKGRKTVIHLEHQKNFIYSDSVEDEIIRKMSLNYCDVFEKALAFIEERGAIEHNSADLLDRVQSCYSFLKKDVEILNMNNSNDPYIKVCADILDKVASEVKKIWYRFIKTEIKYEIVPFEVICTRLKEIVDILKVEREVKKEVYNLLVHREGLKDKLEKQLLEYLEVTELDENRSVYEDHEALAVMYIILHWESQNQLDELDYVSYKNLTTYGEYMLMTFQNILSMGLQEVHK